MRSRKLYWQCFEINPWKIPFFPVNRNSHSLYTMVKPWVKSNSFVNEAGPSQTQTRVSTPSQKRRAQRTREREGDRGSSLQQQLAPMEFRPRNYKQEKESRALPRTRAGDHPLCAPATSHPQVCWTLDWIITNLFRSHLRALQTTSIADGIRLIVLSTGLSQILPGVLVVGNWV